MEFLKRHYEKLILLVLLLAFILSMVYVLRIIDQTKEITEESLQIPTRAADYEVHDPKAAEFEITGSPGMRTGRLRRQGIRRIRFSPIWW